MVANRAGKNYLTKQKCKSNNGRLQLRILSTAKIQLGKLQFFGNVTYVLLR